VEGVKGELYLVLTLDRFIRRTPVRSSLRAKARICWQTVASVTYCWPCSPVWAWLANGRRKLRWSTRSGPGSRGQPQRTSKYRERGISTTRMLD